MKNFTQKWILTVVALLVFVLTIKAQQVTVNVPTDFADVNLALIDLKKGTMVDVTDLLIIVAQSDIKTGANFGNFGRAVKVTVKGAGAGKTIIRGYADDEAMPFLGENAGKRFFNQNQPGDEGSEFIFQDLTFKRWGYGNGNGGAVLNFTGGGQTATFINCHFEQIQAQRGAVVNSENSTVIFDNCFITSSTSFDRNFMTGLIGVKGGTLKVSNTTFMSNIRNPATLGVNFDEEGEKRKGGILSLESSDVANLTFEMTNCTFVNNQTVTLASDVIQPMVSFFPETGTINATLQGNMMIGNRRAGKDNDVDIYIDNMDNITWTSSNNAMNKALKHVTGSFISAEIPGFDANEAYTYLHENILFEMDNNLPKILVDENGVNYVSYQGLSTSTKSFNDLNVSVYPNPSEGNFNVLLPVNLTSAYYEVFNSLGTLIKNGRFNESNLRIDLTDANKGIYILRIKNNGKLFSQKLIIE